MKDAALRSLARQFINSKISDEYGVVTKLEIDRAKKTIHAELDLKGESQPITFDGDSWRDYVPVRLPWTLCIRDRVTPGFVAVLINRAHTYPDLAFPIDAAQERIYAGIDGNRSVGEILRAAAGAGGDEQTRRFIEQLWEYDQIVFDATSSH